ncbi:MAG: benzoate/H(+) symporter BenE family transporter [Rhodospirillales bacterium]
MIRDFSGQALFAGLLAAIVGFASSFPVVIDGLRGVGASSAEAASGLMAVSIAMGLCGLYLSLRTRLPISVAWSTPGAAVLATAPTMPGGFSDAVGAFIVSGALIVISGLWKPLGRWVAAIPAPLANAMLAGVLFPFCLAPVFAVAEVPFMALPILAVWMAMMRLRRLFAMPVTVVAAVVVVVLVSGEGAGLDAAAVTTPVIILPSFSLAAVVSIAVPLFIVTMASQNIPGVAVLNANGYQPDPAPLFRDTGMFSILAAPFGGHNVNLAAITASMCAGSDAHPQPGRRYWAAAMSGVFYVFFGVLAGLVVAVAGLAPPVIVTAVAGLALLGAFGISIRNAVEDPKDREAALVTFLAAASGVSFLGVGGTFWGLVAGWVVYVLMRFRRSA